jgi:Na+-driven multidrug efflux pump
MFEKIKSAASGAAAKASSALESKSAETGQGQAMAEQTVQQLGASNRGQMASNAVNLVVALMVGGLVAAFLLPVAVNEIVSVDTSTWGSGASSLWDIMDLVIILAAFLFFIGLAVSRRF